VNTKSEFNSIPCQPEELKLTIFDRKASPLPPSVKTLHLFGRYNGFVLTPSLHHFDAARVDVPKIHTCTFEKQINNQTIGITDLILPSTFNGNVDKLPTSLAFISFGEYFNRSIENLPEAITRVEFRSEIKASQFNQPTTKFPQKLTSLKFLGNSELDQPLANFPPSLTSLRFGDHNASFQNAPGQIKYSHVVEFPGALRELAIGKLFPLDKCSLPPSLAILVVMKGTTIEGISLAGVDIFECEAVGHANPIFRQQHQAP
jgi:hypothetical protein